MGVCTMATSREVRRTGKVRSSIRLATPTKENGRTTKEKVSELTIRPVALSTLETTMITNGLAKASTSSRTERCMKVSSSSEPELVKVSCATPAVTCSLVPSSTVSDMEQESTKELESTTWVGTRTMSRKVQEN